MSRRSGAPIAIGAGVVLNDVLLLALILMATRGAGKVHDCLVPPEDRQHDSVIITVT